MEEKTPLLKDSYGEERLFSEPNQGVGYGTEGSTRTGLRRRAHSLSSVLEEQDENVVPNLLGRRPDELGFDLKGIKPLPHQKHFMTQEKFESLNYEETECQVGCESASLRASCLQATKHVISSGGYGR